MSLGKESKIFNDPIHGHIELHPLCVKIIDTPQFQRLRFIKQLGGCYFVYPGASHNRFEHSLGVCHLAGQLARVLQRCQPELDISEKDVLCVQIAGLCHDLGHGPLSHVFDGQFIPRFQDKKWKHEDGSVKMFDYLVDKNDLMGEFDRTGLDRVDMTFIKEMIYGPLQTTECKTGYDCKGRDKNKSFLYEIVANKRNGIDVDKWDYFARDCHMLGIRNNFDHNRLMKFSRVIKVKGELQICFRDKEAFNLYEMFHTRSALHRRAYQHKVTKVIEDMITEAMLMANDHLKIPGKEGKMLKMSECVDDMVGYTKLTDDILQEISSSTDKNLRQSQKIIECVQSRRLYKFVCESRPSTANFINKEEMNEKQRNLRTYLQSEGGLSEKDIHVHVVTLDYGRKDQNPMENVRFYNKVEPDKAIKVPKSQVSHMLPTKFAEQIIRVFCKHPEANTQTARDHFVAWCSENEMECPQQSEEELPAMDEQGSTESDHPQSKIPRKQ